MRRILLGCIAMLCCLTLTMSAFAETSFLPDLADWDLESIPLELTLSADVTTYASFDEDRLPQLTNLMKHLALRISWQPLIEETQSTVSLLVDGEEAMNFGLQTSSQGGMAQFSVLPDTTYAAEDPIALLLGTSLEPITLFGLDGSETAWLREGHELLSALESALAPYLTKESNIKTAIKNMGTARRKQDYTIPKADADQLTALLASACPEGRLKRLVSSLVFSGKQTVHIYRDEAGAPLRVEWSGNCGVDEDHLRQVSLTWRLRRDDTAYRDELTLTSPAVRGSDNNKLTWTCHIEPNKSGHQVLEGELSYTSTISKQKTTLTGKYKLTAKPEDAGTRVTGEASLSQQLPGEDNATSYTFTPDLLFSGDMNLPAIDGTLTIANQIGKKLLSQATLTVGLHRTGYTGWQMRAETVDLSMMDDATIASIRQQVTTAISAALLRRLTLLPRDDLDYLFKDLPEESIQAIINAAQSH